MPMLTVKCWFSRHRLRHFVSATKIRCWRTSVFSGYLLSKLHQTFQNVTSRKPANSCVV